ncbi:serine/threonine-protein phosphatase 7 long form homolog [Neltuma alba]|uniref:serine/threonine-protein phosphatase 7 long form homolog n=1 Tax=Neltuma alba TaxID=207710 RepID=UPI0010A59B17|nr:serine/threonine-protein phosphatase 7 long form homolog [Prosopis alba]
MDESEDVEEYDSYLNTSNRDDNGDNNNEYDKMNEQNQVANALLSQIHVESGYAYECHVVDKELAEIALHHTPTARWIRAIPKEKWSRAYDLEGQFDYDRGLVSVLVERWHPETYTFHNTRGECTIILEDVAKQFGLPCEGITVIGRIDFNWQDMCECLLSIRPPVERLNGQQLLISWLEENFNHLFDNVDDIKVQQFTRAYILKLIGGYLMPNKSGSSAYLMYLSLLYDLQEVGKFSWGLAVLAYLYRELCNATNLTEDGVRGLI